MKTKLYILLALCLVLPASMATTKCCPPAKIKKSSAKPALAKCCQKAADAFIKGKASPGDFKKKCCKETAAKTAIFPLVPRVKI